MSTTDRSVQDSTVTVGSPRWWACPACRQTHTSLHCQSVTR